MRSTLLIFSLTFCFGCTKSSVDQNGGHYYSGDLFEALNQQYESKDSNLSQYCDGLTKELKYEIALELQKHETLVRSYFGHQINQDEGYTQLGQFSVFGDSVQARVNEWTTLSPYGWPLIIQEYKWAKKVNTPVAWADLNKSVREILPDDLDRIVNWTNMSLKHDDVRTLDLLYKQIDDCTTTNCSSLSITSDVYNWATEKWFYSWHLSNLKGEHFSNAILDFKKRLNQDLKKFTTYKNPLVQVRDSKTLVVPISAEHVKPFESAFENLTQKMWSTFGLNVEVAWTSTPAVKIEILPSGSRGEFRLINDTVAIMRLPLAFRDKTLTHEFGHALGLRDKYFTTFDYNSCLYSIEVNSGDIMSNSKTGSIQKENVEDIARIYQLKL